MTKLIKTSPGDQNKFFKRKMQIIHVRGKRGNVLQSL